MANGQDEVDRIVAAWAHERPDLNVEPLSVFSRITRLARHLDRARREVFAAHRLEVWGFDVLAALRRSGQPYELTTGTLMNSTMVSSGTMTNRVDRLAAQSLVARTPDAIDRRVVRVRLSDQGLATVDAAMADLLQIEAKFLGALPADHSDQLAGLLREMLIQFEE